MSMAGYAFAHNRLTIVVTVLLVLGGFWAWSTYPSQEEPTIPINQAVIQVMHPAYDTERMEALVVRPLERRLRELREAKTITSTIRPGTAQIRIEIHDNTPDYDLAWTRLRAKVSDAAIDLPEGTIGPFVNDDFGRVAVASVALTATDYPLGVVREQALALRDRLTAVPGVESVSVHGLVGERIEVRMRPAVLTQIGIAPDALAAALAQQNVAQPGGRLRVDGVDVRLDPLGAFREAADVENLRIGLPGVGAVRIGDIATVHRLPADPLETAAFLDGESTVVFAVSMVEGRSVVAFTQDLRTRLETLERMLPAGFRLTLITDQGDVVQHVIGTMTGNLYQTIGVVLLVTIAALGLRAGLIVGAAVPLTMLTAIVTLRAAGVELNQVSIAAFIISLGILVNNANVVVDDTQARIMAGEHPRKAALHAADSLSTPLLIGTVTTVLSFAPPLFTDNLTAIYMRTFTVVMAVTLLVSWVLAVTVAPLVAARFVRATGTATGDERYRRGPYALAGRVFDGFITRPRVTIAVLAAVFSGAVGLTAVLPTGFLPYSDRPQLQIPLETAPGTSTATTAEAATAVTAWLTDGRWPEIEHALAYVGEGGPRFILGLNPPDPAPHRAYLVVNLQRGTDIPAYAARLHREIPMAFPELRTEAKPFSLGETDAGQAVIRISGADEAELRAFSAEVEAAFRSIPGTIDVRNDWENRLFRVAMRLDEAAARHAGASRADIAEAVGAVTDGAYLSTLRDGEDVLPIVWRAEPERRTAERLSDVTVADGEGAPVPLSELVTVEWTSSPAVIHKRDLQTTITIVARNPAMTAQELVDAVRPVLDELALPPGTFWEVGGEIEENEETTIAVTEFLPLCLLVILLIFVWRFNSIRRTLIIVATAPFCFAGAAIALVLAQAPFDFMSTIGMFALIGLIVSNAILVLEQIEAEQAAGRDGADMLRMACLKRLRPIFVTQATTVLGLVPLLLSGEALWVSFNLVVIGGLTIGSLASLALIPALYSLLFPTETETASPQSNSL